MNTLKEVQKLKRNLEQILHFSGEPKNIDFYISSLSEHNHFNTIEEILAWLREMNDIEYFNVKSIPLDNMRKWNFNRQTGDLEHETGGFFSIRGLKVNINMGPVKEWTQPIIDQPEIGVLGILTKKFDGILYFLIQAKAEPGNINTFQLSPTVQATKSNYLRLHGGKATKYLEYFLDKNKAKVLVDQLQSEQGARFFRKRNRNIIVQVPDDEDIRLSKNYRWITLGQLLALFRYDNIVNMDCRSVISTLNFSPESTASTAQVNVKQLRECLEQSPLVKKPVHNYGVKLMISAHPNAQPLDTIDVLLQKINNEKITCELGTRLIPLKKVMNWRQTPMEIFHEEGKYFSIIGVQIESANREVASWDQPIIRQKDPGIVGLLSKDIEGVLHFLVQLKLECGVLDLLEISPTVQCITGNYSEGEIPPFVETFIHHNKHGDIIFDTFQTEEGGRFFHESNRNILLYVNDNFLGDENPKYLWMTLYQLKYLIRFNNFLNVEIRSLLSGLQLR